LQSDTKSKQAIAEVVKHSATAQTKKNNGLLSIGLRL
jgi:hypothetical protein